MTASESALDWGVTLFFYLTVVFPSIVNVPWIQSSSIPVSSLQFSLQSLSPPTSSQPEVPVGIPCSPPPDLVKGEETPGQRTVEVAIPHVGTFVIESEEGGYDDQVAVCLLDEPSACLTCVVPRCSMRAVFTPEIILTLHTWWLWHWLEAGSASWIRLCCCVG